MNTIEITVDGENRNFRPGDRIPCLVRWDLEEHPQAIEVSLVWHTRGIGNEDVGVGDTHREEAPDAQGEQRFELTAPEFPYSFSGKLISLGWDLEAHVVKERGKDGPNTTDRIVIAPEGEEIQLR